MIEAELKAWVAHPEDVRARLEAAAGRPEHSVYRDTYYDRAGELAAQARELRLRTVTSAVGEHTLITYKGPVLDEPSGSKAETETELARRPAAEEILTGLGYAPTLSFTKRCDNYGLSTASGRPVLATLVEVPELHETFIEVETDARDEEDMRAALEELREVLGGLGIGPDALTTELYTDAVAAARASR